MPGHRGTATGRRWRHGGQRYGRPRDTPASSASASTSSSRRNCGRDTRYATGYGPSCLRSACRGRAPHYRLGTAQLGVEPRLAADRYQARKPLIKHRSRPGTSDTNRADQPLQKRSPDRQAPIRFPPYRQGGTYKVSCLSSRLGFGGVSADVCDPLVDECQETAEAVGGQFAERDLRPQAGEVRLPVEPRDAQGAQA